jgi:DNA-binding beta-propeller fold protein YncE
MQRLSVILLLALAFLVGSAAGQAVGVVCDRGGSQVIVFDADADVVLGAVTIPPLSSYSVVSGCAITSDGKLAFVSDFEDRVWVVDLTASPPALATGKNPIPVSTWAIQMAVTPDDRYLVVADGFSTPAVPLSVVDIATRTEIDTFPLGVDISPNAVALGPDGSVLVVAGMWGTWETTIRRLRIDAFGSLTDTGESIPNSQAPNVGNLIAATMGVGNLQMSMGIFLSRGGTPQIGAFSTCGLKIRSTQTGTGAFAVDGVVNRQGNRLFVRTNERPTPGPTGEGNAFIDVFRLHVLSGRIGLKKLTIPLDRIAGTLTGAHQMALHPKGKKLYVSGLGLPELRVFHSRSGHLLETIKLPALGNPTAIAVAGK